MKDKAESKPASQGPMIVLVVATFNGAAGILSFFQSSVLVAAVSVLISLTFVIGGQFLPRLGPVIRRWWKQLLAAACLSVIIAAASYAFRAAEERRLASVRAEVVRLVRTTDVGECEGPGDYPGYTVDLRSSSIETECTQAVIDKISQGIALCATVSCTPFRIDLELRELKQAMDSVPSAALAVDERSFLAACTAGVGSSTYEALQRLNSGPLRFEAMFKSRLSSSDGIVYGRYVPSYYNIGRSSTIGPPSPDERVVICERTWPHVAQSIAKVKAFNAAFGKAGPIL